MSWYWYRVDPGQEGVEIVQKDRDLLRFAGLMGHEYCLIVGPEDKRRIHGECNDITTGISWCEKNKDNSPRLYRRLRKGWRHVAS